MASDYERTKGRGGGTESSLDAPRYKTSVGAAASAGGIQPRGAGKAGKAMAQVFLDPADIDELYGIASREGTSLSAEIRRAVKHYLRSQAH